MKKILASCALLAFSLSSLAAEMRYVTDTLWLQLRAGPSLEYKILKALPSGENLFFLDENAETGYTRVKTDKGLEGYVLTRFLELQPTSKEKLVVAQQELEKLKSELTATRQQRDTFKTEADKLRSERSGLGRENTDLGKELESIKNISSSALELNEKVQILSEKNRELELQNETLSTENTRLHDARQQTYILYGGGLVFVGILAGLILPSLRGRRNSGWA
jgi:SH3 domain protein